MRKLTRKKFLVSRAIEKQTSGSETSQYREEKRPIGIPLVAASETGEAQTQPQNRTIDSGRTILGMGVQSTASPKGE